MQALIIAYCGHRRWVEVAAPLNAEARAIEKCRPCPTCGGKDERHPWERVDRKG